MVDTPVLGAGAARRGGSSPLSRTITGLELFSAQNTTTYSQFSKVHPWKISEHI